MGKRGEYWETDGGNLVDPPEVTEASKSREYQQPSPNDVGQTASDQTSPGTDSHSMDGASGDEPGANSDAQAVDPGDGSRSADEGGHSMDGAEAAQETSERDGSDASETPPSSDASYT